MTSLKKYTAIGLMSGTSMDGVDASLLTTDGYHLVEPQASFTIPYDATMREAIASVIAGSGDVEATTRELTLKHAEAVKALLVQTNLSASDIDLIGFHGQTVDHRPHEGVTVQLGDGELLAQETGIDVVYDFRTADVKAGGEGAPLAPIYHRAICDAVKKPIALVNIGGVSNITYMGEGDEILAFDTGAGNALIDDLVNQETGKFCDEDGVIAASGTIDETILQQLLSHPYFERMPPKSLDRNEFRDVLKQVEPLTFENKIATLTAFTASAILASKVHLSTPPATWYITGGGRHNKTLMRMLSIYTQANVQPIEALGFDGDALEAEAFAYLAVRSVLNLPQSFATTTGIPMKELVGGRLCPFK